MIIQGGKRTKIIAASTAEEFETKLNKELEALDRAKTKYELQFNHALGFCAYIVAESKTYIAQNAKDEYELLGISYKCINCPMWVHPTKGNVKYTRCEIVDGMRNASHPCCEEFYEMLKKGEVKVEEREDY